MKKLLGVLIFSSFCIAAENSKSPRLSPQEIVVLMGIMMKDEPVKLLNDEQQLVINHKKKFLCNKKKSVIYNNNNYCTQKPFDRKNRHIQQPRKNNCDCKQRYKKF